MSGAAGYRLDTATRYLRRTTSGAAGYRLGTTIKYLRRTTSGAAGIGLGTTIKNLHGAVDIGLGICRRRGAKAKDSNPSREHRHEG
jgi:hypothetical protein